MLDYRVLELVVNELAAAPDSASVNVSPIDPGSRLVGRPRQVAARQYRRG
jgi:hypothetical protein